MSDAYLTLDSGGLDDDSLERVHFADIAHKGRWSVVKLGLELVWSSVKVAAGSYVESWVQAAT